MTPDTRFPLCGIIDLHLRTSVSMHSFYARDENGWRGDSFEIGYWMMARDCRVVRGGDGPEFFSLNGIKAP